MRSAGLWWLARGFCACVANLCGAHFSVAIYMAEIAYVQSSSINPVFAEEMGALDFMQLAPMRPSFKR
jgi:hypothetical protein